ncbi:MAG: hypothetical protein R3331_11735 [Sulfurospirillaceae bacterium]|nr:hypothetical protein [Sulfurospirillaceae bacterium]
MWINRLLSFQTVVSGVASHVLGIKKHFLSMTLLSFFIFEVRAHSTWYRLV